MTTFQVNSPVVSELIWLELDRNLSDVYIEKRSLYGQSSGGLGPDVAVGDKLGSKDSSDIAEWPYMSIYQRTGSFFLNLLDSCLTSASSLKTSSRSDVGRFLMKSTDISTPLYRVCSETIVGCIYLSSEYI